MKNPKRKLATRTIAIRIDPSPVTLRERLGEGSADSIEHPSYTLLLSSGATIPAFAADSITADRKIPCAIVDSSRSARAAYTLILTSCADLSSGAAATTQSAR